MKIAYIFAYFGDGGAEENAILLAQKAKEAGHEAVFIFSKYSRSSEQRLQKEGFRVIDLLMDSSFNILAVIQSAIILKKIVKSNGIDIVHSHMLREQSIAIIAKIFGGKFALVRTFHRFDQFNWKMKPLMPIYRKYTDAFISISELMSLHLKDKGLDSNVHLISNGVSKIQAKTHERALGFIGRLTSEKGILKFVQANIDILRDNKLLIAGNGPELDNIKKIISDNDLDVELLGNVMGPKKTDFFKKISVLVLPSRTEVLPLAVLEAYSCGLPVAAFSIKPLKKIVTSDNGVLVDYPDYIQLGRESIKLVDISDRYHKSNIAKYESEFSVDIMWQKTDKLYRSLSVQ